MHAIYDFLHTAVFTAPSNQYRLTNSNSARKEHGEPGYIIVLRFAVRISQPYVTIVDVHSDHEEKPGILRTNVQPGEIGAYPSLARISLLTSVTKKTREIPTFQLTNSSFASEGKIIVQTTNAIMIERERM